MKLGLDTKAMRLDLPFISDCIGYKNNEEFICMVYLSRKINCDVALDKILALFHFNLVFTEDSIKLGSSSIINTEVDLSSCE